jgi:hypothetical protein
MPYYAQITNGTVTSVTESHSPIASPDMVEISSLDVSLLGQTYTNGVFVSPAPSGTVAGNSSNTPA